MPDLTRQRWFAFALLALLLYLLGASSLYLVIQVAAQVLFRFRKFQAGPAVPFAILSAARWLATPGALLLPLVFPAIYLAGLARRWSSLGFMLFTFALFVALLFSVTVVSGAALSFFASMCSGAWA